MPRRGARRPPEVDREAGFTMIEMLVASAVGLIVIAALVMVMTSVIRAQPAQQERAAQIQDGRVMLERMVRDLRQGQPVTGATSNSAQITVDAYTRGGCNGGAPTAPAAPAQLCRITYACTGGASTATCTRSAGTGPALTFLTGLESADVFSYGATTSPSCTLGDTATPGFVCLTLAYPAADGDEAVTFEDSAYLRNPA